MLPDNMHARSRLTVRLATAVVLLSCGGAVQTEGLGDAGASSRTITSTSSSQEVTTFTESIIPPGSVSVTSSTILPTESASRSAAIDSGVDASTSCTADPGGDPENCGRCGHSCQGGACSRGVCQPVLLTTGPAPTRGLAVDAVNVYWATTTSVMSVLKGGGTAVSLVAHAGSNPWGVAVDATNLYWVNNTTDGSGGVFKYVLAGGAITTLAPGLDAANYIALDSSNVYVSVNGTSEIESVPIAGGHVSVLYTGQTGSNFIAVDGTNIYWTTVTGEAWQCAKSSCSTTGVETAAVSGGYTGGVAVLNGAVYTAFFGAGTLEKWSIGGGDTVTLASMPNLIDVVADGTGAYWMTSEPNGGIFRVGLDGGAITTLATNQDSPYVGLALDGTSVYWANSGNGTIMKVAKP